eukprot:1323295-Amorphochlora_amoeboformis.AAC.1
MYARPQTPSSNLTALVGENSPKKEEKIGEDRYAYRTGQEEEGNRDRVEKRGERDGEERENWRRWWTAEDSVERG